MRCGLLSAGLLMSGEIDVELILATAEKPTEALLQRIASDLPKQLSVCIDAICRECFSHKWINSATAAYLMVHYF
jgi:hypothetical protein